MNKTVYFAHGKESGPWGTKIRSLAEVAKARGFEVISPDYSAIESPDLRAEKLIEMVKNSESNGQLVLAGSSMGSYVSTIVSEQLQPKGLFLLAPAFYLPGYNNQNPTPCAKNTLAIHGWQDEVVPVKNAIRFSQQHQTTLHLIEGDHRLTTQLPQLCRLFDLFLTDLSL
jgi:alpha/beta superfamily hydrolase